MCRGAYRVDLARGIGRGLWGHNGPDASRSVGGAAVGTRDGRRDEGGIWGVGVDGDGRCLGRGRCFGGGHGEACGGGGDGTSEDGEGWVVRC